MHCLHAYVIKEGTIDVSGIPHASHNGFIVLPMSDQLFAFLGNPPVLPKAILEKLRTFAEIQTDYFGGGGEQEASVFIDGVEVTVEDLDAPINWALKKIGVVKVEGCDEFDTISLGSYREVEDIFNAWNDARVEKEGTKKSGLEIERRFLLKRMPSVLANRQFNGHPGSRILQTYCKMPDGEKLRLRVVYNASGRPMTIVETKKTPVSYGTNMEVEQEITSDAYNEKMQFAEKQITKYRYEFEDCGLTWEVDDFGAMIIAEIELPSIDHPVELPESFRDVVVMEITGMDQFTNYNLATKI